MALNKTDTTRHSIDRIKSRLSVPTKRQAEKLIKEASQYGKSPKNLDPGPIRDYVERKASGGKRVKVFKQIIFIFCQSSNKCITCYPIPEELLNETKDYEIRKKP